MSFDSEKLYDLLPAIYRLRDAEQGEPLKSLLAVIAEQVGALEENLAQLYDDQFIETAADWAVPYLGDLIGYRALNGVLPQISSPRAEVANTLGYRRRKGTAAVLEQLARDVTGWDAHVVEFFQWLATTQYMNHIRLKNIATLDLRQWAPLERLGTAFETSAHTLDVRRVASGRGRYNIPSIGIFLWRIHAYALKDSPAARLDNARFLFSPLGNNTPLYASPVSEKEIQHLATPENVPQPIQRRALRESLDPEKNDPSHFYGKDKSIFLEVNDAEVDASRIVVCDLSDAAGNKWAHKPPSGKIALDPVLGRIAFPSAAGAQRRLRVSYHYGFSANMGGGDYDRAAAFEDALDPVQTVAAPNNIQDALNSIDGRGGVEIADNARYDEDLSVDAGAEGKIELRAANHQRPHLAIKNSFQITGGETAQVTLNGLLISGNAIQVTGKLGRLRLTHCTLVPGLELDVDGAPVKPEQPSLIVSSPNTIVEIDHCIVGGIRGAAETQVTITHSIVDATEETRVAFAAPDDDSAGGALTIRNSTVIGKIHTPFLDLASNVIFLARLAQGDKWSAPVRCERKQEGCVRFSYAPPLSVTPRRFKCQPTSDADDARVRPMFTSLRYGDPGYCQLSPRCAIEIRAGADDEAEMGAFHDLFQPQRESNLRVRLDEYLRFGLEAGIFYAS